MLYWLIGPLRYLRYVLSPNDSPQQLAMGLSLGILVGLVPKGNLTAVGLTVILFASRANLGTGMLAALGFSWVSTWLDPITHAVGLHILTWKPLQAVLASLYDRPLVPWTALDNTVVVGSLVLGLGQCCFSYHLTRPIFERYQPVVLKKLRRKRSKDAANDRDRDIEISRRAA